MRSRNGGAAPGRETSRFAGGVLFSVCLAALVLPLSFSGGAVATPAVGRSLGGSPTALNWITNAFMLSFGSCLMAAGTLADRFGRKRVFITGVAAFTVISVLLGLSPSVPVLDLLRAAQGIAAAAALSGGSAALAQEFEGHARTQAFSLLGTTFGVGLALGPIAAGALIETLGWRSVFLSAAIVGCSALIFGVRRMRESRDPHAAGLDWPGTLSFTCALSLLTFGVIQGPESGWNTPPIVLLFAGATLSLAIFVVVETRRRRPMLDLSLFRYPRFVGVQILPVATCYCYVVLLVLLPLRFIGVDGFGAGRTGLLMAALSAPLLIVPLLAAALARRIPAGTLSAAGLLIAAAGLFWLARMAPGQTDNTIVLPMLVIGCGAGLPWGLMDGLSVSIVPKERAGMATGIFSTTRVAGEGIALAIVSALLAALIHTELRGSIPHAVSARMGEAAQLLATGDLRRAVATLPEVGRPLLLRSYGDAFRELMTVLAWITIASAAIAFGFLRGARPQETSAIDPTSLADEPSRSRAQVEV